MNRANPLNVQWRAWSAAYAARNRREKLILGVAILAVVFALLDNLWLTPSWNALKAQQKTLDQKRADLAQLVAQTNELAERNRQRSAQLTSALTTARQDVGQVSAKLAEFERTLVPARRMTEFLRGLMPASGVEVVGLKTLAPTPLVQRPAPPAKTAAADVAAATAGGLSPPSPQHNLFKHGVEITLSGNYPALLNYLERLENSPQKVLWGKLELRVDKHPRNELKLVLYTLSLDPAWLAV